MSILEGLNSPSSNVIVKDTPKPWAKELLIWIKADDLNYENNLTFKFVQMYI